ncbi:peptidoglycan-binding domain-containing protein [Streptomyces coffeae]|uniref:Peptidoglycan-binding protein n=1 Tax=Streptomyces coffeae TaxID=621382 RepID=A0ABS1NJF4_9ACTN|nr:peptidoglycan-binding domain-containing protein [Streptomyces coffeae]MBL1100190.1 peptidoglycan-binding protein [Streptomyces coffeae]
MTAESCPHCLAPARANGRPGCACAARAAAAADASTAGDTDDRTMPVRPVVTHSEESVTRPDPRDVRLFERGSWKTKKKTGANAPADTGSGAGTGTDDDATQVIAPVGGDRADGDPDTDASAGDTHADAGGATEGRHRKSRRKPVAIMLAGAAAVAVAGTLAFGTGLLGGDSEDDGGGRSDRTLATPRPSSAADNNGEGSEHSSASGGPSATAPALSGPSGTDRSGAPHTDSGSGPGLDPAAAPPSASASASASHSEAEPEPTKSSGSPSTPPTSPDPTGPPVLSEGDSGAEVSELQKRLTQLLMYIGTADGTYDEGVKDAVSSYQDRHDVKGDPDGVYGENTRRDLESRTDEP